MLSRSPRPIHTARRTLLAVLALCVTALLTTGCLKVDMDATVRSNDTVDGTLTAAVRVEATEILGVPETEAFVNSLTRDVPGAERVDKYDDGSFVGKTVHFSDVPLKEFSTRSAADTADSRLAIRHEGDRYVLTGRWDIPRPDGGDALGGLNDSLIDSARFTVRIGFPGKVVKHNGDLNGTTVTWNLALGEDHELFAEAKESTVGKVVAITLGICVGIIVIAAIAIAVQLRRYSVGRQR